MKKENNIYGHFALLFANLIYGINYTVAKGVMPNHLQPFGFIFIRVVGACVLFWLLSGVIGVYNKIEKRDHLRLALCAFFGVAMNQMFFFNGLNITTPINAGIIMTLNPVMVLLIGSILIKERITMLKVIGILVGMSGAITLIVFKGEMQVAKSSALGDLFIFINATAFAVFLVISKPLMNKFHPFVVIRWVFLYGIIYVTPFGLPEMSEVNWGSFDTGIWISILYVVVCTTFLAYLLNIFALNKLNSSVVSSYIYLQPVFATIVAIIAGKDSLNLLKVISAILIFTGVYLVSKKTNDQVSKPLK
ncbi:MAG: DMT family transporter [Flavobacteriales bacterium]